MLYQRLKRATTDDRFTCAYFHEATTLLKRPIEDIRNEFYDAILMHSEYSAAYILPFLPFLRHGLPGISLLQDGCRLLQHNRKDICCILDLSTMIIDTADQANDMAQFAFHVCGVNAAIIAPHRGYEPLAPFLMECNHGALIDLRGIKADLDHVSEIANQKNCCGNCGVVVRVESPADIYLFRRHSTGLPMIFDVLRDPNDVDDILRAAKDTASHSAPFALLTPTASCDEKRKSSSVFQDEPTIVP